MEQPKPPAPSAVLDWITAFIAHHGYLAIALLMIAENVFPPLPSELIMPFAGYVAARGELNAVLVVVVGALGSVLGSLPWYAAGRCWGGERLKRLADRHGRWLAVSRPELDRVERWFHRHGRFAVALGRLVPGVRTLSSVPAGVSGMPVAPFASWSLAGSLVWCALLTAAGFLLSDRYAQIAAWLDPAATLVLAVLLGGYLLRVLRPRRRP